MGSSTTQSRRIQRWYNAWIQDSVANSVAKGVANASPPVTCAEFSLHCAVQTSLSRVVVLRILECWGLEPEGRLAQGGRASQAWDTLLSYLSEVGDRYMLPMLYPALAVDHPRYFLIPPMVLASPATIQSVIQDLYTPQWTTALFAHPETVLDAIYALAPSSNLTQRSRRDQTPLLTTYGAYYTPRHVVQAMVDAAFQGYLHYHGAIAPSITVLDPACGLGAFLIGLYEWRVQHQDVDQALAGLYGVDREPQAVDMTKLLLVLAVLRHRMPSLPQRQAIAQSLFFQLDTQIQWGNAVIAPDCADEVLDQPPAVQARLCPMDWPQRFATVMQAGGFDVVIGNPPYLDSEWMTRHLPYERHYCARHYTSAMGNWDLFCVFIEQALNLCKPGGITSLIVPNKLLSAPYAAGARTFLAIANTLSQIWDYASVPLFPVAVYPIVYLAYKQVSAHPPPIQYTRLEMEEDGSLNPTATHLIPYDRFTTSHRPTWSIMSPSLSRCVDRIEAQAEPLGAIATVSDAATVSEAYDIQHLLQDTAELDEQAALRLVNSGTIDRYIHYWGRKPLRYLKRTYLHPVVPLAQQALLPKTRQQQARQPKIVIASMTKRLECVVDRSGTLLAGKSTSIVLSAIALSYLVAILNSRLMSRYYEIVFGGHTLQGGYLRIGAAQLRSLPIRFPPQGMESPFVQRGLHHVECLLTAHAAAPDFRLDAQQIDHEIDRWVYQLYGLSEGDVAALHSG